MSSFQKFVPLLGAFMLVSVLALLYAVANGLTLHSWMMGFMGFFFLLFGALKLYAWNNFVEAYRQYDFFAQHSSVYASMYPFIECILGSAYLAQWQVTFISLITVVLLSVNALSVVHELWQGKKIACACMGTVFTLPMTWVTVVEDLFMVVMAVYMLIAQ